MKWLALFTAGCFCVLASYCYGKAQPYPMRHYSQYSVAKPVVLHRDSKAEVIAGIWGIGPKENLAQAVDIFRTGTDETRALKHYYGAGE